MRSGHGKDMNDPRRHKGLRQLRANPFIAAKEQGKECRCVRLRHSGAQGGEIMASDSFRPSQQAVAHRRHDLDSRPACGKPCRNSLRTKPTHRINLPRIIVPTGNPYLPRRANTVAGLRGGHNRFLAQAVMNHDSSAGRVCFSIPAAKRFRLHFVLDMANPRRILA